MSEIQNDIEEQPKYIEEQPKQKRPKGRPRETEEMKAERRALTRNPDIPPVGRPKWNPDSIHYDVEKARDYHREYYHLKLKGDITCPHCHTVVQSKIALNKHNKISKTCELARLKNQIKTIGEDILRTINN